MDKQCIINNKAISYFDRGEGKVIVLLHGYLETKEVWNDFAKLLANKNRVIAIDIPGHGESDVLAETHTMELMAEVVKVLLQEEQIERCTLIGHSMGAYVMLAFAKLYPEALNGFVLFHSSVYADTVEKRTNRLREIELIKNSKLELIVNSNLPNTFATDNLHIFLGEIETLKVRALRNSANGVCALLRGMMIREDSQDLIRNFAKPMLFIFGEKDNYIPKAVGEKMSALSINIKTVWLKNSGHMGFIEEKSHSYDQICDFIVTL